jgi:putative DeoR family transcriptional regulator (stage III sporulation protein D)
MKKDIIERTIAEAEYILQNKATVRQTADALGGGKSTVHNDMIRKLPKIDNELYERVKELLELNFSERHIRGGEATRRKYFAKEKGL